MSCFFCGHGGGRACKDCGIEGCQSHFSFHNKGGLCMPWRVGKAEGAGNGLFATRNIKGGEVVLKDWPVVEGPMLGAGDQVCVVCLDDQESSPCGQCSLPVCKSRSMGCQGRHRGECQVLSEAKQHLDRPLIYTAIAVIRLLVATERDMCTRSLLEPLMDHRDNLAEEGRSSRAILVKFLSDRGYRGDGVERALGLLQTNGITSLSVRGAARGHALYPIFSYINNSCVSNTRHGKHEDAFCLIATVDINKGDEITTNYKSPTLGNIVRKPAFKKLWNFDCGCPRCSDPTELGTFSSSIKCKCGGFLIPVDTTATQQEAGWKCDECENKQTSEDVFKVTQDLQDVFQTSGHTVEQLEKLLSYILQHVHPHHYIAMQVTRMLVLLYGNCNSHRLDSMSAKDLARKAELSRDYIQVFSIIEPGLTKWKGRVSEELARALVRLEGRDCAEAVKWIGEAGKCRQLDTKKERADFTMRIAQLMNR